MLPNEFTMHEKLMWCNELGSMLMREHLPIFERITLTPNTDGTYTLPDYINSLDVDRIIANGKVIRKKDGRFKGITYLSAKKGCDGVPVSFKKPPTGSIEVIYKKKYENLRYLEDVKITAHISKNFMTTYYDFLKAGDELALFTPDNEYYVVVTDITYNSEGMAVVQFNTELKEEGETTLTFTKYFSDETVVDAPFDMLYVNFLNAKYCFYQRDYENYNAHMALFNSRLADLDLYLAKTRPSSPDTILKNWF